MGPLRDAFLIYNSQAKSKGMAVVTFQRAGDAAVAKAKYDGKIVDGRESLVAVFAARCWRGQTMGLTVGCVQQEGRSKSK